MALCLSKMNEIVSEKRSKVFVEGIRDGFPIGAGYFAVAFALGILAKEAGLTPIQGFVASMLNVASAGEYALFTAIRDNATYLMVAINALVINLRYMLMSCAVSQKFDSNTGIGHRLGVGFGITDEIFGITIARPGKVNPIYNYGAIFISVPLWSLGTSLGIIAGNVLPVRIVSALSVALYGMFIAIIVPPAKKDMAVLAGIVVSFILSYLCGILPVVSSLSSGNRTILLTILISAALAVIKPVKEDEDEK